MRPDPFTAFKAKGITTMAEITRRSLLTGAALGVAATAVAVPALAAEAATCTYADTIPWGGQYDVVVMGAGFAGLASAIYASREGASVLLFDVAPEWEAGGNSRYCAQIMRTGTDREKLIGYYEALYGERSYDKDIIAAFIDGQLGLDDMLADELGADRDNLNNIVLGYPVESGEYPEYPGAEESKARSIGGCFDSGLFKLYRANAFAEPNIDFWYNARGTKLIQDPQTKTIVGVEIEKDGQTRKIRANNGVVMACGGFENNQDMAACYLELDGCRPIGSLWNRGDGVKMALDVNADLWHMGCYNTATHFPYCVDIDTSFGEHAVMPESIQCLPTGLTSGSFVVTGADGSRFQNETSSDRHGRLPICGEWLIPKCSYRGLLVMDAAQYADMEADPFPWMQGVPEVTVSADSIEELAEKMGADPAVLTHTVEKFNMFCEQGEDYAFGRKPETMRPIVEAPFYAMPLVSAILNTQGGARRNADAEVLDTDGNPIPHLYSAGEFGGLTGKDYEGAANVTECVVFGKIAGINAAAEKDPLPEIQAQPVESTLTYTLGSGSSEMPEVRTYDLAENQAVGTGSSIGGELDVMVTLDGDTIVDCQVVYEHETKGIGTPALEQLPAKNVETNGTDIDAIAGATMTSTAIRLAAMSALEQLGR